MLKENNRDTIFTIYKVEDYAYLIPKDGNEIYVYDFKSNTILRNIIINQISEDEQNTYTDSICIAETIYLSLSNSNRILCLNVIEEVITYIDTPVSGLLFIDKNKLEYFICKKNSNIYKYKNGCFDLVYQDKNESAKCLGASIYNGCIYIPYRNRNAVGIWDTYEKKYYEWKTEDESCFLDIAIMDTVYLLTLSGYIYKYNEQKRIFSRIEIPNYKGTEWKFRYIVSYCDKLILLPRRNKFICILDKNRRKFDEYDVFEIFPKEEKYYYQLIGDKVYILNTCNDSCCVFDLSEMKPYLLDEMKVGHSLHDFIRGI